MKKLLIGLAFVSIALMSCNKQPSSSVDQDKIYTHYEVFYNKNTDKTVAIARFRFGGATGTLLELEDDSYVTYQGDTLAYNALYSGHVKEYAGLNFGGSFEYRNNSGIVYTNNSLSFDSIAFPSSFDTLSKSLAYDLVWDGSTLDQGERVGIFIGSAWVWGQDALLLQTNQGANNIIIGTNNMSNLATGPSICHMERVNEVFTVNGTTQGGKILSKYKAQNHNIIVVD